MKRLIVLFAILASTTLFAQQFLPVKGIVNARDLGGYTLPDGRHVKSGQLIRSAQLADATNKVYEKDVKKYVRRVKRLGGKEAEIATVKAFLGANTDNFIKALDAIDAQYGSLEAYLKGPIGLSDNDIAILKERYTF